MTIITKFEKKCSVCGRTSLQPVLGSTNTWGYPDIDLRPPEMQRSTIDIWLVECPHCGYVASNIENELEVPADILKTDEYLTCEGKNFKSKLSERFYKHYLISKAENNHDSEFLSLLHCAWTCDDNDDKLAVEIRKMALKSMYKIEPQEDDEKNALKLIEADLLRRSLQFDEVIRKFKDVILEDKTQNDIISFQIELSMNKDSACHTVEEVVKK
ncbi:MAG: hypothetical protein E7Z81_04640 [Methanobrevibacter sp.]|jgi:hypothetical protein|uniref:hypothetical protein n=1 Tax=Methanobrevibacter sp. TaxID=66852 RepID=UPI0025DF592B|nr:hypothetical protein [Methanobrevibacter sp.]MBE6497548.1 hypothetical protein [Methanobrevibacter sp.]